jgi:PAS domain S-box-containing protein
MSVLKDKNGDRRGSVIIARDITERKRAEKETKETKEFLENIFRTSVDGIIVTDPQGFITMTNEAVEKILGYSKDELIGKYSEELKSEKGIHKGRGKKLQAKLFKEGAVAGIEHVWLRKDGSLVETEMNMALLKDNKGDTTGVVAGIRDITERKKFEEELKKSEEKYHSLIEKANDAIISSGKDGRIVGFNKKAEEMFGYSRGEILGKSVLMLLPQDNKEINKGILKELKTTNRVSAIGQTLEAKGLRKDGREILVEASYYSFEVQGEHIITALIRNITERKEMEEKLLQSEKLKSLGELSGGVAHDFNNVLAAILGRVQLLKMQIKAPLGKQEKRKSVLELRKGLEIIERASLDGAETVRRIQEFSRKRADDKGFTKIDINELIDNALDFTKMKWKGDAESKGIKINIKKEFSPLPPTSGSASELREVFTNLINNAIDAMPQGGRIKIKTFKENNHISIKVEDTGVGISESVRNRIFDPFFTTKGVQSTGLGMSVSYGIIHRHRGTILVDSTEGKGTTVTITIPISDNIRVEEEKTKPRLEEKRKSTILVIEDEEDVRNLLSDILIENGHQVETASDGNQGIDMFKKKDFDLVFTDLGMPGTSGWEVAETVKSINGRIPVAIITGWNVELKESEMRERGVNLIAYKPFKIDQILRLVQEGMELREQFEAA